LDDHARKEILNSAAMIIRYTALFGMLPLLLFFSSCDQKKTESLSNNSSIIIYETVLSPELAKVEWVKNIDSRKWMESVFSKVENGELIAYSPYGDLETAMTWEDILFQMDALNDTVETEDPETKVIQQQIIVNKIHYSEIKGVLFIEDWRLNPDDGRIEKEILGIAPIRYYAVGIGEETRKSIVFACYFTDNKPPLFEN
jgi:hypothetical protein